MMIFNKPGSRNNFMRRAIFCGLVIAAAFTLSCKQINKSWDVTVRAANEFQSGKSQDLCSRFTEEMISSMPCDSVDRVIRQVRELDGEPDGKCGWNLTYKILKTDPFRTITVFRCPYQKEAIKLSVVVDVTERGTFVSGLWADSERMRKQRVLTRVELCRDIDDKNGYQDPMKQAAWSSPKIFVWTSWQGIKEGDKLAMEWRDPAGVVRKEFDHTAKCYDGNVYNFWTWIEPDGIEVENPYGAWTVVVGVNGKPVEEYPVEIVRGAETPEEPAPLNAGE